jgi:hypothetical protein
MTKRYQFSYSYILGSSGVVGVSNFTVLIRAQLHKYWVNRIMGEHGSNNRSVGGRHKKAVVGGAK